MAWASVSDLSDTGELGKLGLPVRVRQASLAPQLRDARPASDSPPARAAQQASPEAARNTMAHCSAAGSSAGAGTMRQAALVRIRQARTRSRPADQ